MAQQLFIAPLVCVTTNGMTECAPKLNPQQVNYTAVCQDATIAGAQCLVLAVGDLSGANADSSVVALIESNFDTATSAVPTNVRNRINNGLSSKNITLTRSILDPNDPTGMTTMRVPVTFADFATVRDFLTALGIWFSPTFTLENFWVSGATRQIKA
jgi:hypothetical protein